MRNILLKILTFSVFLFCGIQVIQLCSNIAAAEEQVNKSDSILIKETVRRAVNDNRWFQADSLKEVKNILDDHYTGHILDELAQQSWQFVQQCTDWHYQVLVKDVKIIFINNDNSKVYAFLEDFDPLTGNKNYGKAVYTLKKISDNWKINSIQYKWNLAEQE